MAQMKVNFNNVRRRLLHRYNDLAATLNVNIEDGMVRVETDDIQECMDDLRMLIGTVAMTYEEDNADFKDIFSEVYPEHQEECMVCFNPDLEDE